MTQGIYCIANTVNGKSYIGSSRNVEKRFSGHRGDLNRKRHSSCYLQRAWNKYGEDSFAFTIVEVVDSDLFLTAREQFWMWRKNAFGHGYNMRPDAGTYLGHKMPNRKSGGTRIPWSTGKSIPLHIRERMSRGSIGTRVGMLGKKHSAETRQKISEAKKGKAAPSGFTRKGKAHTIETKLKMRKRHIMSESGSAAIAAARRLHNKSPSAETRLKISLAQIGILRGPRSAEAIERHRSKMLGRIVSEETRRKISAASKGRKTRTGHTNSAEHRAKISAALRGRRVGGRKKGLKHTPEAIANMRRPHVLSEAGLAAQRAAAKRRIGRKNTPETIAMMRASALCRCGIAA